MSTYGKLYVRVGPMFSGKSTWLRDSLTQYSDIISSDPNKNCRILIINHSYDIRSGKKSISNHSSQFVMVSGKIDIICSLQLADVNVSDYDIIGIDEANLFTDLVETTKILLSKGKFVYVAGLDADYMNEPFGDIAKLLPLATEFKKMCAICTDCIDQMKKNNILITPDLLPLAAHTFRLVDSTARILIGGAKEYTSLCTHHYYLRQVKQN